MGINKLYNCNQSKLNNFINALENEEEFYFGKNFTYVLDECYFSEENKKILDYLNRLELYDKWILEYEKYIGKIDYRNILKEKYNELKNK